MRRNRNQTETERRTENVHEFDFIFSVSVAEFQQIRVYNLVIMKDIDGLSSETIVQLFYKHNTIDYRILWDNTQRL